MHHFQRQPSHKNFNNNIQYRNISWNEKYDELVSPSEMNEFEKLLLCLDGAAGNPYLDKRDDVGNGRAKLQQYKYRESEQRNLQSIEKSANFSFMNPYNENVTFNLSFEAQIHVSRRRNSFCDMQFDCLSSTELYASEAVKEIGKYWSSSDVSDPVYQLQSALIEKDSAKSSVRDYIETFTSTLCEQNEMQKLSSFNAVTSEERIETPDVSNLDALCNNDSCASPKSFEDIFKESFLCYSNIPLSESNCGNFGFTREESYEERYNKSSSIAHPGTLDKEFPNNYEPFPYVNDVFHPLGTSVEARRHPQKRRFICPLCGITLPRKDYLDVHYLKHTGEKPYACDRCEKRFITKGQLTKHQVSHSKEKPFVCGICKKRFSRKGDVTRHLNSHSKEKKYKCSICGKGFDDHSNRNRHCKKIHNGN